MTAGTATPSAPGARALDQRESTAPGSSWADGPSNSRSEDKKCPRWSRHGLDTVSVLWGGLGGSELLSAIERGGAVPYARGLLSLEKGDAGARVMAWPEYGTVKLECRLAALADATRESHRLGTRDELRQVGDAAAAALLHTFGFQPTGSRPEIGRTDLVTEIDFADGVDGLALLRAMRALVPPGYKSKVHSAADGRIETVAIVTPSRGRTIFRAYDKGVESGTQAPGERIRFEAQVQRPKSQRQSPELCAAGDLAAVFGRTIQPFMKGDPVTVTTPSGVVDQVAQKLSDGELTAARAERLVGSAELLRRYGRGIYDSDHQSARRLRALRDAGIAVDDELPEGATVPVSDLLAGALEEWSR